MLLTDHSDKDRHECCAVCNVFSCIYPAYAYNVHMHIPRTVSVSVKEIGTSRTVVYPAPTMAAELAVSYH